MTRAIALVAAAIAVAIAVVVGLMPSPNYWFGPLLPMLVIVAAGFVLLLWTAFRRRSLEDDHQRLGPSADADQSRPTPDPTEEP